MKQAAGGDRAFEQLVARELSRRASQPIEACPQAELLAAWFDRSLAGNEAAFVERHLAECDRCQALVAALARSEPEVVYARPRPEVRAWTWHVRSLAAAATALVVAAVGLTVAVLNRPERVPKHAATAVARLATEAPVEAPAPAPPPAGTVASPGSSAAAPAEARSKTVAPPARQFAMREQAPAADSMKARQAEERPTAPGVPTETGRQAAAVGGVEKPDLRLAQPTAAKDEAEAGVNQAPPSAAGEARVQRLARGAPAAAPAPVIVRDAAARPAPASPAPASPVVSFAPGGRVGWRYARPGVILRTDDGGAEWTEQALPTTVGLAAISAVSPQVCWAIGDGVVVRTADGRTWLPVTPPVTAGLVSIVSTNEAVARVRTADGVAYETSDAGATWRRR